jgi:DNA-binding response OmpR family regulator
MLSLVTGLLHLEDEALLSIDFASLLEEWGIPVFSAFTCVQALVQLERQPIDLAVLNWKVGDGTCEPVARELHRRSIPFLIYSSSDPAEIAGLPELAWLSKPAEADQLKQAIYDLAERRKLQGILHL